MKCLKVVVLFSVGVVNMCVLLFIMYYGCFCSKKCDEIILVIFSFCFW